VLGAGELFVFVLELVLGRSVPNFLQPSIFLDLPGLLH
jgi:hypothetical protein